jgi:hypothetical protein
LATARSPRRFTTTTEDAGRGRVRIPLPFDPDEVWGPKPRHHLGGTIDGQKVRAVIDDDRTAIVLGAMWVRDAGVPAGRKVTVVLEPEGPQAELAADLQQALAADPAAKAFFDGLAPFYRKAYVRWIDATTRKPELRPARIAEVVALCHDGRKART